uniref:Strictosidine synthase conserved region domain-containing protein n=1 Tax=Homalodisca liturata TaxID=320908 RepID=A0A1B6HU41_9HEMI
MGILTTALSIISKIALFLLLLAVVPGLPPYVEFEAFSIAPSVPLEGYLTLNSRLNGAERLFKGQIHGPEDLKVHNGQLYTTLHGGHVVRIVNDKIEPIVKFGQQCEGFHEEDICGRPLGLAFDKNGMLYVADAYFGIFKVDPSTGKSVKLVSMNDTIEGKKPRLPNGIAVGSDGSVYWTDSSTSHSLHDGLFITLASGNGRLLKYSPSTKSNTVLLDKIHFANGVALSDDESFLVICETISHRLLRYHLRGPQAGQSEVFLDGLPGTPDNIHPDGKGGFVVSLLLARDSDSPSLIATLGPYPLLRKLIARVMFLVQAAVKLLRDLYPVKLLKKSAHIIGHFESLPAPSLVRVTVLFLTREGKVSRALFATDGLTGVSDCVQFGDYYYLGSPFNHFLARVRVN